MSQEARGHVVAKMGSRHKEATSAANLAARKENNLSLVVISVHVVRAANLLVHLGMWFATDAENCFSDNELTTARTVK
ncbi:MAG TPA: hypothetical protein VJ579_03650 [Candidatus Paceibacterota bacterium]|nr:hypothetical protein [Candidatus Paceibacterota bacterium]